MRENWLSSRVLDAYCQIVVHCCDAWNKLFDQLWRIMSIGMRDWAYQFESESLGIMPFIQRQITS